MKGNDISGDFDSEPDVNDSNDIRSIQGGVLIHSLYSPQIFKVLSHAQSVDGWTRSAVIGEVSPRTVNVSPNVS